MGEKQLKSVHITNYYHKNSGGISNSYNRLLDAANRHKRYVRLIVPGERSEQEEVGEYGRIYYVEAEPFPFFDQRYRVMQAWKTYLKTGMPIRNILTQEQPDIIEIAEKYSLSLLAGIIRMGYFSKLQRPMLVQFTCERMDDNVRSFLSGARPFMWFARRVMGNYNLPMFDFHVGNSDYTAQELFDSVSLAKDPHRSKTFFNFCWRSFRAPRVPIQERIFVNPRGVNSTLYTDARKTKDARQVIINEASFPHDATILLYAGRISPEKNVELLPQIMRLLTPDKTRDYRLLIAGDGPQKEFLNKELERFARGKYKFLGHVTDKEKLANLYANADVFIHPNPREPFGIAPLEAMASGTPVVAPDAGGILTYANATNMWLVAPDGAEFAAAIRDVLRNEINTKTKVANALQTAKSYTWERSTDRLFQLYDQMYADFSRRKELYAYETEPKEVNFFNELLTDANLGFQTKLK